MTTRAELLQREYPKQSIELQSINDNKEQSMELQSITKEVKLSTIDNRLETRVQTLHFQLQDMLNDTAYDIAHTYKIAKYFDDVDIYQVAEYCRRKANMPGRAFVTIMSKKMQSGG